MRSKPITFRGVTYPSLRAAEVAVGRSRTFIRDELRRGRPAGTPHATSLPWDFVQRICSRSPTSEGVASEVI